MTPSTRITTKHIKAKDSQTMMFTGSEANKLLYIARFPNNPHSRKLLSALDGEAREVALIITGKKPNNNPERRSERQKIADAFQHVRKKR